jgi:hypothetical protein
MFKKRWAVVNKVKRYAPGKVDEALKSPLGLNVLILEPFTLHSVPDTPAYVKTFYFKTFAESYCTSMNLPPSPINACVVERI